MRRTKEEAEQTRRRIMAAALRTFYRYGVARATLEQIARAARVTRGAIYWHFSGKEALLRAIREDVSLPLVDQSDFTLLNDADKDPLDRIEQFLVDLLRAVEADEHTRLAFFVLSFKCEYVGELQNELEDYLQKNEHLRRALNCAYTDALKQGTLREGISPGIAALETIVFLTGLMRLWLLDERGSRLRKQARQLIRFHVEGRARDRDRPMGPQKAQRKNITHKPHAHQRSADALFHARSPVVQP